MAKTILIADDNLRFVRKCRNALESCGYRVKHVSCLDALFEELCHTPTNLVIVGQLVSGVNADEIYRVLCHWPEFRRLNILIHAAATAQPPKDLDIRPNAFVCEPFDVSELIQRVRNAIGRSGAVKIGLEPISAGPLTFDPRTQAVTIHDTEVLLSRVEFRLLYYLARQFGATVPRQELMFNVWGTTPHADDESLLNAYIMKLRKKVESGRTGLLHIVTVPGAGYRLQRSTNSDT